MFMKTTTTKIANFVKNLRKGFSKGFRSFNGEDSINIKSLPMLPNWVHSANLGIPRNINYYELRQYAKSAWVQMAVNSILKQVITTKWDIVPKDDKEKINQNILNDILYIKDFLNNPNQNGDTFNDVWIPFLRDILELDSGVVYKARNLKGELKQLFVYDGARFLINMDEHQIIPEDKAYYQYSFRFPNSAPLSFKKNDIIYGKLNTNTELFPYGWSPLMSVVQEVELMIQSTRYNKDFFQKNAIPDGIISLQMDEDSMEDFRNEWYNQVKGRPHKLIFHNAESNFTPLRINNKDMDWLEGQKWYFHIVFGNFGLSPQEAGFYENSNRSTSESQERISLRNAIKPLLQLVSDKINREILPELTLNNNLKFKWFPSDDASEKEEFNQTMSKLDRGLLTINEVRQKEGLEPVEWGDTPFKQQNNFQNPQSSQNNTQENKKEENKKYSNKNKEKPEQKKHCCCKTNKQETVSSGEDVIDLSLPYEKFLKKKFDVWEKKVLDNLDKNLTDEVLKSKKLDKTFGEFVNNLFNSINTLGFRQGLSKAIKDTINKGVDDVENELDINVSHKINVTQQVKVETEKQLEGFYIEGKKWNGIKGVSEDTQKEILKVVEDGLINKKGLKKIREEIQERFDILKNRATTIARTESTRYNNMGKLEGYKKSGIVKRIKWDSFIDNRTSEECRELNNHIVDVGEKFILLDGREFEHPPSHINCRSVIIPHFDD